MPTYEYVCKECGEGLEVVQSFDEPALTTCARCGGPLRKVFGNVGIVFKGSGFYKTDSRSTNGSGSTKTAGGEKTAAKASESGGGTSSGTAAKEPAAATSSTAPSGSASSGSTGSTTS